MKFQNIEISQPDFFFFWSLTQSQDNSHHWILWSRRFQCYLHLRTFAYIFLFACQSSRCALQIPRHKNNLNLPKSSRIQLSKPSKKKVSKPSRNRTTEFFFFFFIFCKPWPLIFKFAIHCLVWRETRMVVPSLPKIEIYLLSGEVIIFSKLFSGRPIT